MAPETRISTGSECLDTLLGGGIGFGSVTFVYGEPASGKTTFALTAAANCLRADRGAMARYADSDGKLSLHRLAEVAGNDAETVLSRIEVARPQGFDEQAAVVEELLTSARRGDIVVVDSVTGLYRAETGDAATTWAENKELNRQMGYLKEAALTLGAAVLLTGQVHGVVGSPAPQVEPVAQRLLRYWSDIQIRMEPTAVQSVRRAAVERPATSRGMCRLRISARGLEDAEAA